MNDVTDGGQGRPGGIGCWGMMAIAAVVIGIGVLIYLMVI